MASGDSFLNTLTIEGEYDRSHNFHQFKKPVVYVRLPSPGPRTTGKLRQTRKGPANRSRCRGQSVPPALSAMARRRLNLSPPGASAAQAADAGDQTIATAFRTRALQLLSRLWLPACFLGINGVCFAIDPPVAALMLASSTFLLHQMGAASRHLTLVAIVVGYAALLLHGSDILYIMAVHTLYYCAISMKSTADSLVKTKRTCMKRSGWRYDEDH